MWKPVTTKIIGLVTGKNSVDEVGPGGSIGVLTSLDPSIVKSDSLVGNVAGHIGKMPKVFYDLSLEITLLNRVVGSKSDLNVEEIKIYEPLMLNVNSAATIGVVSEAKGRKIKCTLKLPVCAEAGSRITISRRIENRFRLIGYGIIK